MIWDPETLRHLADELEREADYRAGDRVSGCKSLPITSAVVRSLRAKAKLYRKRATISEKARAA